jgi:hypothetical protein
MNHMRSGLLLSLAVLVTACEPELGVEAPEPVASISQADYTNGCSAKGAIDWLVLRSQSLFVIDPLAIFNAACDVHDNCYHSGLATYGKTQSQCDRDLYTASIKACRSWYTRWWEGWQLTSCKRAAWLVYQGVDKFGWQHFHNKVCTGGEVISTEDQAATGRDVFKNLVFGSDTANIGCSTYSTYDGVPTAYAVRRREMIESLDVLRPGGGAALFDQKWNANAHHSTFKNWISHGVECEVGSDGRMHNDACTYTRLHNPSPGNLTDVPAPYNTAYYAGRDFHFAYVSCGDGRWERLPYLIDYLQTTLWFHLVNEHFPARVQEQLARMHNEVRPPWDRCYRPSYPNSMSWLTPQLMPDGRSNVGSPGSLEYGNHADWDQLGNWAAVWKEEIGKLRTARAEADKALARHAERVVFDEAAYFAIYPALDQALGGNRESGRQHWTQFGINEGRTGSAVFDSRFYLGRHGDVANAYGGQNFAGAMNHFLTWGLREGRASSPVFDADYYYRTYQNTAAFAGTAYGGQAYGSDGPGLGYVAAARHYLDTGMAGCYASSPGWNAAAYLRWNPDVANYCGGFTACACGTWHYLAWGRNEGRRAVD